MTELAWVDGVVLVRVVREDGRRNVGTGFVCGPGRVLTARHTILKDTPSAAREISIHYCAAALASLDCSEFSEDGGFAATMVWPDETVEGAPDCCILEAATPPGFPALPFADPDRNRSTDFTSWGFPNGARNASGAREGFPLSGERLHGGMEDPMLQADVRFETENTGGWRGYSGAPVVEEHQGRHVIVGMIVQELKLFEKPRRLNLVPYDCLSACEGFSANLAPDWQSHDFDRDAVLERLQDNVGHILEAVLKELGPDLRARIAALPPERLSNDLARLAEDMVRGAEATIEHIGVLVDELQATDMAVAGLVGRIGQALHLLMLDERDMRLVNFMHAKGSLSALREVPELHAATLAKIELLAAALDGRSPEFLPRKGFGGDKKSPYGLELHVPVSGANSVEGLCDAAEDLRQHTGADLLAEDANELAEFLAGSEEQVLERSEVEHRRGSTRRQMRLIARALKARPANRGRFYVVAGVPESDDARLHVTAHLCDLLDGIPDLLGFSRATDLDAHEEELDQYLSLDKTIPQQKSNPQQGSSS